ncbi:lipocalin family protein [Streptomyces longispororuber]|uniref:lipocalin family protein n=1 Tax=Streptomyces longispororuber TaxID=68230 RepID=UPI00210C5D13|nr:lipocalin family protein [Streptomyces longispororuber]MCQ4205718.1 lipocalin family protein [Streptomyces longispororuber]
MPLSRYATALPAALLGIALAAPAAHAAPQPPPPVGQVDVSRYQGTWYQIAAVPRLFEIQCAKNVHAVYTLTAPGTVGVRNSCTTWLGNTSGVTGEAKALDSSGGRLNVSFVKTGGSYRHSDDANYIVTGLDPDYRWAVITDSDRRSGFVLSRTPELPAGLRPAILASIDAAGLDACDFLVTRQDAATVPTGSFC